MLNPGNRVVVEPSIVSFSRIRFCGHVSLCKDVTSTPFADSLPLHPWALCSRDDWPGFFARSEGSSELAAQDARSHDPTVSKYKAGALENQTPKSQTIWRLRCDRPALRIRGAY